MSEGKVVVGRLVAVVGPPEQSPRRAAKVGGPAPEWIQIFPDGEYTYDWEGKVETATCDAESRALTITAFAARGNDLVIDYEHQTLYSDENGQPAPAAGFIKELADRGTDGLWARVEWTAKAQEYLRSGEYRYDSPVFTVNTKTRRVVALHHVALTNWPATHNRTAITEQQIAAKVRARIEMRSTNVKEGCMDSKGMVYSLIKWGANLPDTATNNDVKAYLKALDEQIPADDNLFLLPDEATVAAAKKTILEAIGSLPESIVAAKSVLDELELPEGATLAQVHAKIGDFKAASAERAELVRVKAELATANEQIVTLSAKSEDEKLDAIVTKYKAKLPPSKEPWFRALAKRDGLVHAEEVARELKNVLPDSSVADSPAPTPIDETVVATTRKVRDRELPVDRDSAVRKLKVDAIRKEKPELSYRDADKELTRRETAAS